MFILFPIALVLSIFCLALPAWADFQAGMTAHRTFGFHSLASFLASAI